MESLPFYLSHGRENVGIPQVPSNLVQDQLSASSRAVVLDWVLQQSMNVLSSKKLEEHQGESVYFHTLAIFDRYIAATDKYLINRYNALKVAACCYWIAVKFNDAMFDYDVGLIMHITEGCAIREDFLATDRDILITLKYDLFHPTVYDYIEYYAQDDFIIHARATYFAEMFSMGVDFWKYKPSEVAASCIVMGSYNARGAFPYVTYIGRLYRKEIIAFICKLLHCFQEQYNCELQIFSDSQNAIRMKYEQQKLPAVPYSHIYTVCGIVPPSRTPKITAYMKNTKKRKKRVDKPKEEKNEMIIEKTMNNVKHLLKPTKVSKQSALFECNENSGPINMIFGKHGIYENKSIVSF